MSENSTDQDSAQPIQEIAPRSRGNFQTALQKKEDYHPIDETLSDLPPLHLKAIDLVARGYSLNQVSKALGLPKPNIARIVRLPAVKAEIKARRGALVEDVGTSLIDCGKEAVERLRQLVQSPVEKIALGASQAILDQLIRYRDVMLRDSAMEALKTGVKDSSTPTVLSTLPPEMVSHLLKSGAALKGLDLSKVPMEVMRLVMKEVTIERTVQQGGIGSGGEGGITACRENVSQSRGVVGEPDSEDRESSGEAGIPPPPEAG